MRFPISTLGISFMVVGVQTSVSNFLNAAGMIVLLPLVGRYFSSDARFLFMSSATLMSSL